MSRESITRPPQLRNGGSPLAHLPSSTATPLDPLRWLAPPQRAPELQPPVRASDAATSTLAHYNEIMSQQMISLYKQALAECAELAAHAQRVETAQSVVLAAWRRQEDAAHVQALAEETDIRCRRNDTFHAITNGFAINLNILAVEMASWHGADDAMALLAMKCRKDDAIAQGYIEGRAARALQNAAVRVNVLAASRPQEDDAHAKAFASKADKSNRREATLRASQLQCVAQLGFTSSEFFAWVAECNASWDGAVAEAPNHTPALAERASANNKEAAGCMRNSTTADMATTVFVEDTRRKEMAGATHHRAVAECDTTLVLPTSGDNASAPTMMPPATPMAVLSSPPRPTSYVGVVLLNIEGGAHVTSLVVAPSPQPLVEPRSSAADGQPRTVCRHARPRRRTGRCNRPQVPSPPAEAATVSSTTCSGMPSTVPPEAARASSTTCLGTPSTVPPKAARASSSTRSGTPLHVPPLMARASSPPCLRTLSTVPPLTTSFTPSSHPVKGDAHQFRDGDPLLPPQKRSRRKHHPCRVCRRHGPRAPNPQEHLLHGRQHRPRTPNKSTRHGWD
jgi:hypothetical protein